MIKVKRDACFYIKNLGKKLVFVNGQAVESGKKRRLPDNSIIEVVFNALLVFIIKDW
jgi:hypothetical protein